MKRWIALLLAAVLLLSCCVGCTPKEKTEKPSDPSQPSQPTKPTAPLPPPGKATLKIQVPNNPLISDYNNNALTNWLEAECNVELEINLAGGKYDILWGTMNDANSQNAFDLSGYFADREGASKVFWDRLEENFSETEIQSIMAQLKDPENNGAIYAVPSIETSLIDTMDYQMWINTEWLDDLDLEKPHDIDSLYNVLKAFKTRDPKCIPLYGSAEGGLGADVVNWLINLYIYYDNTRHFNVDENGQLYAPFTTDQYREALKFINKLIDEGLLLDSCFITSSPQLAEANTPANGVPLVGIFAGHLTLHATPGNPVLYQYEALPLMKNVVFMDNTLRRNVYITKDCANPDKAFEVLMKMWSEEGSYRVRYGEYGVNWTEPDEGAKSAMGLDCKVKILKDPFMDQRTCNWGDAHGTLNVNSEGETSQYTYTADDEWQDYKAILHAQSRKYHDQAAAANNPKNLLPVLAMTEAEKNQLDATFKNTVMKYYQDARVSFCKGKEGFDPYDNEDWNNYLAKLEELGLQTWIDLCQTVYDRQMKG